MNFKRSVLFDRPIGDLKRVINGRISVTPKTVNIDTRNLTIAMRDAFDSCQDFDERVRRIAEIAREQLGAISVVVWEYDRIIRQLKISATPGVVCGEWLRGATAEFRDPGKETEQWYETLGNYDAYRKERGVLKQYDSFGAREISVRVRNIPSKSNYPASQNDTTISPNCWKVAKLVLFRRDRQGVEVSSDRSSNPVCEVYFNFLSDSSSFFCEDIKDAIRDVARLIRELLITKNYRNAPDNWNASAFLHEIDLEFAKHNEHRQPRVSGNAAPTEPPHGSNPSNKHEPFELLEQEVANHVIQAAVNLTANFDGQADLVILLNPRLGRVLKYVKQEDLDQDNFKTPTFVDIRPGSTTNACIESKRHCTWNDLTSCGEVVKDELTACSVGNPPSENEEIPMPRSFAMVPILLGDYVCAVVRLANHRRCCFPESRANALSPFAQTARFAFLRLEDHTQRILVKKNLDFFDHLKPVNWTDEQECESARTPWPTTSELLARLHDAFYRVEYVVFWPVLPHDASQQHGAPKFGKPLKVDRSGIFFRASGSSDKLRADGWTANLVNWSRKQKREATAVVQIWNPNQDNYTVEVYAPRPDPLSDSGPRTPPPISTFTYSPEHSCTRYLISADDLPDTAQTNRQGDDRVFNKRIPLKPGQARPLSPDTRIGLVLRDDADVVGFVWIKLRSLGVVTWWECEFLDTVAQTIREGLRMDDMHLAFHGFEHRFINKIGATESNWNELRKHLGKQGPDISLLLEQNSYYLPGLFMRSIEMENISKRSLNIPVDSNFLVNPTRYTFQFALNTLLFMTTKLTPDDIKDFSNISLMIESVNTEYITNGTFLVLWHLLENAVDAIGMDYTNGVICIWIRIQVNSVVTLVANNEIPSESSERISHVWGLPLAHRIAMMSHGILNTSKDPPTLTNAPEGLVQILKKCTFFAEFSSHTQ